jgi:hypothetical protein
LCCSVNGRAAPDEPLRGKDAVNEKNERRERYQRDVQRRSHLHGKREIVAEQRTATANMKRPSRESGVVRGSEIMKKEKINSDPLGS